jgi:signal transduction histidine kinase
VDAANESVALTAAQAQMLNRQLAALRHELNNRLSVIVAAAEIIRNKPDMTPRMLQILVEQPAKITALVEEFSAHFERALGLRRQQPQDTSRSGSQRSTEGAPT